MPFTYCTECGYKNVYTIKEAKFCAGCGQSLTEEARSQRSNPNNNLQSAIAKEEDAEAQEGSLPNIQKLEYTVDMASSKLTTIGDLINTKKEGTERLNRSASPGNKKNSTLEELEAQSIRECRTSKFSEDS
jgi:hypothetical protein